MELSLLKIEGRMEGNYMKAIMKVNRSKGVVLKDIDVPKIKPDEMLVKVKSAAICGTDIHLYHWNEWCENVGAKNPMVIGHEYCGEVVEVGNLVKNFKVGDLVCAETHIPCGICFQCRTGNQHVCNNMKIIGVHTDGAFAEYTVLPEACAWKLDESTDPSIGAIYEPFGIAVHALQAEQVAGVPVVVLGCGPIGCFATEVAKAFGASQVFAVDRNEPRLRMARQMGADYTINTNTDNLEEIVLSKTNGLGAGAIIELTGSEAALNSGLKALRKGGWVSLIGLHSKKTSLDLVNDVIYKEARIYGITGRHMYKSWYAADEIIRSGMVTPEKVITHHFKLEKVEEAIQLAQSGDAGKIIIDVD